MKMGFLQSALYFLDCDLEIESINLDCATIKFKNNDMEYPLSLLEEDYYSFLECGKPKHCFELYL